MAVAGRPESAPTASDAADDLREARFVRLIARPTGDALAATGLLARALDSIECPFQARIGAPGVRDDLDRVADDETTVIVGASSPTTDVAFPSAPAPASDAAFATARALDTAPDPVLALAGAFAADRGPLSEVASSAFEAARGAGIERRPGIAIPGTGLVDGLAHSTLFHAPFSGDREAASDAMATLDLDAGSDETDTQASDASALDADARRQIASWLALAVVGADDATPRAAERVECALSPHGIADAASGFATVGGYADVLQAVAREAPGTGLALVLGHDAREAALSAWREHARRAHAAVRAATLEADRPEHAPIEGLAVARVEASAPIATVAELLCGFRVAAPAVVVVTDGRAAAAGIEEAVPREQLASAATALDGTTSGDDRCVAARFEGSADAFVTALADADATAKSERNEREER